MQLYEGFGLSDLALPYRAQTWSKNGVNIKNISDELVLTVEVVIRVVSVDWHLHFTVGPRGRAESERPNPSYNRTFRDDELRGDPERWTDSPKRGL
jgi:hypothetical protein